ncbi:MAG: two-component regulator propeller domain-containing protein [Acidithiobacillales bacterium]
MVRWPATPPAVILLGLVLALPARAERLPVERHGVAEGLAEETVTALLRDARGYLWVGSLNGLSRFDGERFKVYGLADGLPKLRVFALAEGRDGTLWVATGGGLVRLDPAQSASRPVFRPAGVPAAAGRAVEQVFVDRAGEVWFGSGGELFRIDRGVALPAGLASAEPKGAVVRSMREEADGTIWIATSRGLFRRARGGPVVRFPLGGTAGGADVRGLLVDRAGRLWVTTPETVFVLPPGAKDAPGAQERALVDAAGHVHLPLAGGGTAVLREVPGARRGLWQKPLETADGRIVLSSTSGLVVLDGGRATAYGRRQGLGGGLLGELLEDTDGNLWIGTQSTGLLRLSPAGFTSFSEEDGLSDPRIASLFSDEEGHVCAASAGNASLYLFDGQRFRDVRFRAGAPAPSRLLWGRSVLRDRSGEWWVATPHGLARYGTIPFTALARAAPRAVYTARDGLGGSEVSALYQDSEGTLWAGVYAPESPLARFDRASGRFESFGARDGLPTTAPLAFLENGRDLWIACGAGGIVRRRSGRFTHLGPAEGVPDGFAHDLLLDRSGRLWIANGGGGALRLDTPAGDRVSAASFTTSEGPATGSVYALAEDREGFVYFGTARGVDRLDPKSGRFRHFTTADGLANNVVTSALRDGSGALWFGTPEGISRLVPAPAAPVPAPRVVITSVGVNGNPRPVPELGAASLPEIVLAPGETRLRIDFAAPSFTPGQRVRFQTQLEGVDSGWSSPTAEPTVRFVGLAPGSYRFVVRTAGGEAEPGDAAAVRILVQPPLWRRAGFLLGAGAAVGLAALLVHRQGVRRAVAVERVRTRLATDLHDDVGSSLARISILSEVGHRAVPEGSEAARLFEEVGETSRGVIDALGDAIWSIDPRRDDLQSLGDRLRLFAVDLLEGRGIAFRLTLPENSSTIELASETRRHLFLLLKEAVTNAARHSRATTVEIAIRTTGRALDVEVRDDGAGFRPSGDGGTSEGRGLSNMAERAAALGGKIDVRSDAGRGTRIAVAGVALPRRARRSPA